MQSLNETMAYLAGLFDGEGCITYKQRTEHRKGKPRPTSTGTYELR